MTNAEGTPRRRRNVKRALLDVLTLISGFIALFQFVVSDNVSSQWFKPVRDAVAEAVDLTEELQAFSVWWSEASAPFVPGRVQFAEWPLASVIAAMTLGLFVVFLLTFIFLACVDDLSANGIGAVDKSYLIIVPALVSGVYFLWVFSAASAPLWVWIALSVCHFGLVGAWVWDSAGPANPKPSPKVEPPEDGDDFDWGILDAGSK